MTDDIYVFGNGLRVLRRDLLEQQIERYAMEGNPNLHEPVEEEWLLRSFARDMPARPVFLDVGAGVGYYSMLVKIRWPSARVLALDALPRHVAALRGNLQRNGLADDAIEIVDEAVGVADGWAEFIDYGYGSSLASAAPAARAKRNPVLRVRTRPLSEYVARAGEVHLMKMDIQGAEFEVLCAASAQLRSGAIRQLLVGTHGAELHARVRGLLEECGYRIEHDDPEPPMQPDGILLGYRP